MKDAMTLLHEKHAMPLPTVSGVANRIVALVDNSRTRVAQLSAELLKKPSLTNVILKKANTIEFGLRSRIMDLDLAIIVLGFDVLKKTIASALIRDALKKIVDVMFKFDELWNHSVSCGVVAHYIASEDDKCDPQDAFVAGILHDIGHLISHLSESEQKLDDHADLGAAAARNWGLPSSIVEAIRWHHTPALALGYEDLAHIVYLADTYCQSQRGDRFSGESEDHHTLTDSHNGGLERRSFDTSKIFAPFASYGHDLKRVINVQQMVKIVKDTIVQALSNLPQTQKVVIGLHYYENLSFDEIGKLCGMESLEVRALHDTAVATLKNMFVPVS